MSDAPTKVTPIKTSDLHFDPDNPRFYRLNNAHQVEAVIEEMLDDESVQDLMLSIGQKGYFEGEPLLVTKDADGKMIAVEGNRRLAAVKLLNGQLSAPPRRKPGVAQIVAEAIVAPPEELPCLVYPTRREVLRYLGYRHITGIKEWDALSKAKYLSELRTEFYKDQSTSDQMKSLSKDIGSRPDYVAQLLTALSLYIKADDAKFFGLPITAKDIEFSYITTALNYTKITTWLGLESRTDIDMPNLHVDNLKRVFGWMFSKDQNGHTILGESRRLGDMASVVSNEEAVKVLEETKSLDEAYLYSDGPQEALNNALSEALQRVGTVWKMLPKTKPLTANHLNQAEELAEQARSIRNHLREKLED